MKQIIKIHNRYDVKVVDAETLEVKQEAVAYNVVTKDFMNHICSLSPQQLSYVLVGSGSGVPSIDDTGLFHALATKSFTEVEKVYLYPTSHRTVRATFQTNELVGKTITEVGLRTNGYNTSTFISHAMLQDSEGNPLAIEKTDHDILYIDCTIYATYVPSGFGVNGVYPKPEDNSIIKLLLCEYRYDTQIGGTFAISPHEAESASDLYGKVRPLAAQGVTFVGGHADLAEMTYTTPNLIFNTASAQNVLAKTVGIAGVGAFVFPDATVYPDHMVEDFELGTGDGEQVDFALGCPHIKAGSLHIYQDDVEIPSSEYDAFYDNNFLDNTSYYLTTAMEALHGNSLFGDWRERPVATNLIYQDPFWDGKLASSYIYPSFCQVSQAKPIYIDFGQAKKINRMYLNASLSSAELNALKIEHSNDGVNWTEVTNVNNYSSNKFSFDAANGIYWRVYFAGMTKGLYTSANGMVFGLGFSTPGLTFHEAPANGVRVSADYAMDVPYKTENNEIKLAITFQFQRG